jgi:WXG100 family type VII secretion target
VAEIEVTPGQLLAAAARFDAGAAAVRSTLGTLALNAPGLGGEMGIGMAAPAYAELWTAWSRAVEESAAGLEQVASKLRQAAAAYQGTDGSVMTSSPAGVTAP